MDSNRVTKLVFTSLCIAIGLLLPKFINLIPIAYPGAVFLPMHIPVLLCGFICGLPYGIVCGLITPLLSFIITGMPPIFPIGISMAFELATYGALVAMMYHLTGGKIFSSLIVAMIGGRIVLGLVNMVLFQFTDHTYGVTIFVTSAFITALPGIVIQLIIIPIIIRALKHAKIIQVG